MSERGVDLTALHKVHCDLRPLVLRRETLALDSRISRPVPIGRRVGQMAKASNRPEDPAQGRQPHRLVESGIKGFQGLADRWGVEHVPQLGGCAASLGAATDEQAAVFDLVATTLCELFEVDIASVVRFAENNTGTIVGFAPDVGMSGATLDLGTDTASGQVRSTEAPVHSVPTSQRVRAFAADHAAPHHFYLGAGAPIRISGQLWGSIGIGSGDAAKVNEEVAGRLTQFAELVSLAISNAEARARLVDDAATDPLTQLSNSRAFKHRLAEEVTRAHRYHHALSLVLIDLDHFKQINDAYGHQVGDRTLAAFAHRLRECAREGDVTGRVGGEEFAWLLPETSTPQAVRAVERLRRRLAGSHFDDVGRVTLSAGVCDLNAASSADELERHTDQALYSAKAEGRDRVASYTHEHEPAITTRDAPSMTTMRALANVVDAKHPCTHQHAHRVAGVAEALALHLGWSSRRARQLRDAALLHDVGKIGIPDVILLKAGPLTPDEFQEISRHSALGAVIAADALDAEQAAWIRSHHERWDASGYPDRLAAEAIPEGARIIALAESYDAMTAIQTHTPVLGHERALDEIRRQRGVQFAPAAVDAFLDLYASASRVASIAG